MSLRIVSGQAKVSSVIVAYVLSVAAAVSVGVAAGTPAGVATLTLLLVCFVIFFTRIFRGDGEDRRSPRPWWRLTARPAAGFVVSAVFFANAISIGATLASSAYDALAFVALVVHALVGLAFVNSSIRLARPVPGTGPDA